MTKNSRWVHRAQKVVHIRSLDTLKDQRVLVTATFGDQVSGRKLKHTTKDRGALRKVLPIDLVQRILYLHNLWRNGQQLVDVEYTQWFILECAGP